MTGKTPKGRQYKYLGEAVSILITVIIVVLVTMPNEIGYALNPSNNIENNENISEESIPSIFIGANELPLYGSEGLPAWALFNLIFSITGALTVVLVVICSMPKQDKNRRILWLIPAVVFGAAGMVLFYFTQDIRHSMVLTDRWTIMHAVMLVSEIIAIRIAYKTNGRGDMI